MKKFISTLLALIGLAAIAGAVYLGSGYYDVAADVPHWKLTSLILEAIRDRAIAVHSHDIILPPLKGQELVDTGFPHYNEMCRLCHGGPGKSRSEFAQGLYPSPPELISPRIQQEMSDQEIYWVVKNGLKMTGMPAFGATHSEHALQGIVAFVRRLPTLTAEEYEKMAKTLPLHDKTGSILPNEDLHHQPADEGSENE